MKTVLVIGGYGVFGRRVVRQLAESEQFDVVVAGRSLAKAVALCTELGGARLRPAALDRTTDLAAEMERLHPWLVIDAAGPFQGAAGHAVAQAAIAAGAHYVDLADARDFVVGISALDAAARARGVCVIAGASSVPALSSAVVDRLGADLDRIEAIEMTLCISNRATVGASMTGAALSYLGRPIRLRRFRRWEHGHGWQHLVRRRLSVPDRLPLKSWLVALCDVPDLALFPERYRGTPDVIFRAGTELRHQVLGLWLLSWPVRWRWLAGWSFVLGALNRLRALTARWGGDRSGMEIRVTGRRAGAAIERRWTILSEGGDGLWVPSLASVLLAHRLAGAPGLAAGARPAAGILTLDEFERRFSQFAMTCAVVERELPPPLYRRVLGAAWAALPPPVREIHDVAWRGAAEGRGSIERGAGLPARLAAALLGLPPTRRDVPVRVTFEARSGREVWCRDFGGYRFRSVLRAGPKPGMVAERFGVLAFVLELLGTSEGIDMRLRHWSLLGIPMPRALGPRVTATERVVAGWFAFDVEIALPGLGRLMRWSGSLMPA